MRKSTFIVVTLTLLALPLRAQRINVDFPSLAEQATEVVDVTLDAQMLRLAAKFFSSGDADERAVRDIVQRLEGIYVRSYAFDREGMYDRRIVESIRKQLGPTWKRLVNVKGRGDNVEVYTDARDDVIRGLVVISADPRELTIVNIVGPIDLERLASLEGQFGIPRVTVDVKGTP